MNDPFRRLVFALPLIASLAFPAAVLSQELTAVDPSAVGLSEERLQRIDATFESYVEQGRLPGAVVLALRQGEVAHLGVYGWQDLESETPMREDSLFRIASQTKALISVGIMILQEEGKLLIGDTLDQYLPEYAETSVAEPNSNGGYEVVPAKRRITLRDLLTHTAGIGYGDGVAKDRWKEADIQGWYFAHREEPIRETVRRMAALPFEAHPGERYVYGYATDILGAVIEVASGQKLDVFLSERILEPLGMSDTHFYLPEEKADRLATLYALKGGKRLERAPDASAMHGQGGYVEGPRQSFSGGAGLVSTARDYGRFLQMLLNGGELEGERILSRKSVELMTVDHMPSGVAFPWRGGTGFGLGFSVTLDLGARGELGSVGEYGWGGAYHSTYWVDPAESLVVVYFTQVLPAEDLDDHGKLRALIYQSLVD